MIRFVTNVRDGKGLARDAEVLAALTREHGRDAEIVDFRDPPPPTKPRVTVHLEVVVPAHFGPVNWLLPNPEWYFDGYEVHIPRFDRILCKTLNGHKLFSTRHPRAEHVGFISQDRLDATVPRERTFWHNPGGSEVKGTDAIVTAWARYGLPYPLTVAGCFRVNVPIPNVTFVGKMPDSEHRREQNRHLYHLCLSQYEGWGHYLHEALSVGAVLASTDHEPMCEFEAAVRVPVYAFGSLRLAKTGMVSPAAVRHAIERMVSMSDAEIAAASQRARKAYEIESAAFRSRWAELVEAA